MPMTRVEEETLRRFQSRIAADTELGDDIRITRRISGGAPGTRLLRETIINGAGRANVRHLDELKPGAAERAVATQMEKTAVRGLLRDLAQRHGALVARADARFVPDSLVGSLTFEIGGDSVTLFYDARAEEGSTGAPHAATALDPSLSRIRKLEDEALAAAGRDTQ